jgi:hypothetical protein
VPVTGTTAQTEDTHRQVGGVGPWPRNTGDSRGRYGVTGGAGMSREGSEGEVD